MSPHRYRIAFAELLAEFAPEPHHSRQQISTVARALAFNVAIPLAVIAILQAAGVPLILALVVSAAFPAGEVIFTLIHDRHLDVLGLLTAGLILLGAGTALFGNDVRLALVKESAVSSVFGTLCLASLARSHPLMYYLGEEFFAGSDHQLLAAWQARWKLPGVRRTLRTITAAWGVGMLLEAGLRVGLTFTLPPSLMVFLSPALAVVATLVLVGWSIAYWIGRQITPPRTPAS